VSSAATVESENRSALAGFEPSSMESYEGVVRPFALEGAKRIECLRIAARHLLERFLVSPKPLGPAVFAMQRLPRLDRIALAG
jgi:hypothetical protein